VDVIEFYDSFTITVLTLLEDCGFCPKGEGGPFVAEGHLRRGGRLPLNTDGGGLSSCHSGMRGVFLIIEAVRQLRGQAGAAQVPAAEVAMRRLGGSVRIGSCCWGRTDGRRCGQEEAAELAPDAVERPFFEAVARGDCLPAPPTRPRPVLPARGPPLAATGVAHASGRGAVHTYTVVRQNGMPPSRTSCPTWWR
jgi:hypothetical protein